MGVAGYSSDTILLDQSIFPYDTLPIMGLYRNSDSDPLWFKTVSLIIQNIDFLLNLQQGGSS